MLEKRIFCATNNEVDWTPKSTVLLVRPTGKEPITFLESNSWKLSINQFRINLDCNSHESDVTCYDYDTSKIRNHCCPQKSSDYLCLMNNKFRWSMTSHTRELWLKMTIRMQKIIIEWQQITSKRKHGSCATMRAFVECAKSFADCFVFCVASKRNEVNNLYMNARLRRRHSNRIK